MGHVFGGEARGGDGKGGGGWELCFVRSLQLAIKICLNRSHMHERFQM